MDRVDAIRVLKEMLISTDCDSNFVALMPPHAQNLLSRGYQIHIKTQLNSQQKASLDNVLRKNGLSLKEDKETLIIYKPIHR